MRRRGALVEAQRKVQQRHEPANRVRVELRYELHADSGGSDPGPRVDRADDCHGHPPDGALEAATVGLLDRHGDIGKRHRTREVDVDRSHPARVRLVHDSVQQTGLAIPSRPREPRRMTAGSELHELSRLGMSVDELIGADRTVVNKGIRHDPGDHSRATSWYR